MPEKEPEKKEESDNKKTIKDIVLPQLKGAFEDLVKMVVNAKYLGIAIVVWVLISVVASVYRRHTDMCKVKVPLDSYFYAKMLCPIE